MTHNITLAENNQSIIVSPSDTIELTLEENPTTGYSWALEEKIPFLEVQENAFYRTTSSGVGSGGFRRIKFSVILTGNAEVRLKEWQRWTRAVETRFVLHVKSV